jgi:hypothetical protein
MRGPTSRLRADSAIVPPTGLFISTLTRCPTRWPQRAQKTSTPSTYVAPQLAQWLVESPAVVTRAPQWPQKGSERSTDLAQRGQVPIVGDTRVAGTRAAGLAGDIDALAGEREGDREGALPRAGSALGLTDRAAEADTGLPQSMQKRDAGSFSRPQKAQAVKGLTAGWVRPRTPIVREYTGRERGESMKADGRTVIPQERAPTLRAG